MSEKEVSEQVREVYEAIADAYQAVYGCELDGDDSEEDLLISAVKQMADELTALRARDERQKGMIAEAQASAAVLREALDYLCSHYGYQWSTKGYDKALAARKSTAGAELLAEVARMRDALEIIRQGKWTESGDLQGAAWSEIRAIILARNALDAQAG